MQDELIKLLTQNCTRVYNTVRAIPKYRGTYMYISICLVHYMLVLLNFPCFYKDKFQNRNTWFLAPKYILCKLNL